MHMIQGLVFITENDCNVLTDAVVLVLFFTWILTCIFYLPRASKHVSTSSLASLCGCVYTSNTAMSPLGKKLTEVRRYGSQMALTSEQDALSLTSHNTHRVR